jgi:hypothetical protein
MQEFGVEIGRGVLTLDQSWDGNAGDAAYTYFSGLAAAISGLLVIGFWVDHSDRQAALTGCCDKGSYPGNRGSRYQGRWAAAAQQDPGRRAVDVVKHTLLPIGGTCRWVLFILTLITIFRKIERVRPGEIVAHYRKGSTKILGFYQPGWHWRRFSQLDTVSLRQWVDEPVDVTSRPIEVRTADNTSVVVEVRLTLAISDPVRYITTVVDKEWEKWQEGTLPILVTQVVSGYTFEQVLNNRQQVAQNLQASIAVWFAGGGASYFGLSFNGLAIARASGPRTPKG